MADKKKKPNWIKIRTEYETSNISYRKLAEKYSVSPNTLQTRAVRENWSEGKKKTYSKIRANIQQKSIEKISNIESDINAAHYETWEMLHKLVRSAVQKEIATIIHPTTGEPVEVERDTKDLDNISKALEKIQRGQRLAKNIISQFESEKLKIDKEKLDMEAKRLEQDQQEAEASKNIRIIIEGELEDMSG